MFEVLPELLSSVFVLSCCKISTTGGGGGVAVALTGCGELMLTVATRMASQCWNSVDDRSRRAIGQMGRGEEQTGRVKLLGVIRIECQKKRGGAEAEVEQIFFRTREKHLLRNPDLQKYKFTSLLRMRTTLQTNMPDSTRETTLKIAQSSESGV